MKTFKLIQSLGLAAMISASTGAFAHGHDDSRGVPDGAGYCGHPTFQASLSLMKEINARQDHQHDRILDGYFEKRINPNEFRVLMAEQNRIRDLERAFLADGFLGRNEYLQLDSALDKASRNIHWESHDPQGGRSSWNHSYGYGNWSR